MDNWNIFSIPMVHGVDSCEEVVLVALKSVITGTKGKHVNASPGSTTIATVVSIQFPGIAIYEMWQNSKNCWILPETRMNSVTRKNDMDNAVFPIRQKISGIMSDGLFRLRNI